MFRRHESRRRRGQAPQHHGSRQHASRTELLGMKWFAGTCMVAYERKKIPEASPNALAERLRSVDI